MNQDDDKAAAWIEATTAILLYIGSFAVMVALIWAITKYLL